MAKQSKFIRTKPGDVIMGKVLDTASRASGTMGGLYTSNTLLEKWKRKDKNGNEVPMVEKKYRGPALFILGMAAEVMIEQPQIESFAQGLQIAGVIEIMSENILKDPTKNAGYGLAGIGENASDATTSEAEGTSSLIDYDAIYADNFKEAANVAGNYYENYQPAYRKEETPVRGVDSKEVAAHDIM
jgi:hypothetical protein